MRIKRPMLGRPPYPKLSALGWSGKDTKRQKRGQLAHENSGEFGYTSRRR